LITQKEVPDSQVNGLKIQRRITNGDPFRWVSKTIKPFVRFAHRVVFFISSLAQAKRLTSLRNKKPPRYRGRGLIVLSR
jgi:hypothetical protein